MRYLEQAMVPAVKPAASEKKQIFKKGTGGKLESRKTGLNTSREEYER